MRVWSGNSPWQSWEVDEKYGLGPFSHGHASEPRQESDTIIDSADSPVSVLYTFICSVMFRFFAFKVLGLEVQEKSAEHGAEIFTPLFLHFGHMLHGPIASTWPGDHVFNTSVMYTIAYAVETEIDTVSAAPVRSKVALRWLLTTTNLIQGGVQSGHRWCRARKTLWRIIC